MEELKLDKIENIDLAELLENGCITDEFYDEFTRGKEEIEE